MDDRHRLNPLVRIGYPIGPVFPSCRNPFCVVRTRGDDDRALYRPACRKDSANLLSSTRKNENAHIVDRRSHHPGCEILAQDRQVDDRCIRRQDKAPVAASNHPDQWRSRCCGGATLDRLLQCLESEDTDSSARNGPPSFIDDGSTQLRRNRNYGEEAEKEPQEGSRTRGDRFPPTAIRTG